MIVADRTTRRRSARASTERAARILGAAPEMLSQIRDELVGDPADVVRKVAPGRAAFRAPAEVGSAAAELPALEAASRRRLEDFVPASRRAVDKIRRDGADADIDGAEGVALEAIVLVMARPAILVQDGRFFPAPEPWTDALEAQRSVIESVLGCVGRIEVDGHPRLSWVGTAWQATEDVVMTNRHVAQEFAASRGNGRWSFSDGMAVRIDYNEELSAGRPREIELTDVVGVHETLDLALLRCAPGTDRPPRLPIARKPGMRPGGRVYVIGYPAADSRRNDPEEMQRIFAGLYNVKRLQPGEVMSVRRSRPELVHDCSTLGGNSGSCVVDLESSRVVGLHFGGRYLEGNTAIPLWRLADDPLIREAGIEFES